MMRSLPSARTSPGQGPWTESRLNSKALDWASPRSLTETSSRPLSAFCSRARATRRPIRPKPLIATLVAMSLISLSFEGRDDPRRDRFGGEAEAFKKRGGRRGGAEAVEADGEPAAPDIAPPAKRRARLDRDEQGVRGQQIGAI